MWKKLFIFISLLFCSEISRSQRLLIDAPGQLYARLQSSRADTGRIRVLLELSEYYTSKLSKKTIDLDSAWTLYKRADLLSRQIKSQKWQLECLKAKANYFISTGDLNGGMRCYESLANYFCRIGNTGREAQTWLDLGRAIPVEKTAWLAEKKQSFQHAAQLFAGINSRQKQIECAKEIADIHLNEGKLYLAEKELLKVLADYKSIKFKKLHHTYFLLSAVSRLRSDLKTELYYDLEAKKCMIATADTADAAFFIVKLGDCYEDLGMLDNSLANYKEALYKYHSAVDINYSIVKRIVRVMIAKKEPEQALAFLVDYKIKFPPPNTFEQSYLYASLGDCYWALHKVPQAEKAYLKMIALNDMNYRTNFLPVETYMKTYQLMCDFYIKTGKFKRAAACLDIIAGTPKKLVSTLLIAKLELMRFKTDSAAENYLGAIKHYQSFKKINDSVFNASRINEVTELQIRYETKAKDRDLQVQSKNILLQKKDILLLTRQNQLEHYQVEKSQSRGDLTTVCAVVLVLLLGVGYSRYRLKIRSNLELRSQQQVITAKNTELEHLLNENQWLLREVHHRVKNNLQLVISLLNSQSAHLHDEVALNAVIESKMRVQAMSLIHQKLYGCENVSAIFLPEYINDLVGYLKDSFKSARGVYIDLDIAHLSLDISQAVPVGLILNEAITNSFKYAFPHADTDVLTIKLSRRLPSGVSLSVSDNGKGISGDIDINKIKSFGLKLIRGLTEDLEGTLTITGNPGTTLTIDFEIIPLLQCNDLRASLPELRTMKSAG